MQAWLDWYEGLESSHGVLLAFLALGLVGALFHFIGLLRLVAWLGGRALSALLLGGFALWQRLFAWMPWPALFGLIVLGQWIAWWTGPAWAIIDLVVGGILLATGFLCVMAYIVVDLERHEIVQGYKTLHDPGKGQELATRTLRYGHQCGLPLLLSACLASVCGFAILNAGLYNSVAKSWYVVSTAKKFEANVKEEPRPAAYADFLAYSLLNLASAVDLIDLANSSHLARLSYVRPRHWAASTLQAGFRGFFTAILVQQLLSWFRRQRLLTDSVKDFWSPNEHIQSRAGESLSRQGARAVGYLIRSVESLEPLTPEQIEHLPTVVASIGPTATPTLVRVLDHPRAEVREVAVTALGKLNVLGVLPNLAERAGDPEPRVRRALVVAIGELFSEGVPAVRKRWMLKQRRKEARAIPLWRRALLRKRVRPVRDPVDAVLPMLTRLLSDASSPVREGAAVTLARFGSDAASATPGLARCVEDEDAGVRRAAAEALGAVREPVDETVAALVHLLEDQPNDVKRAALASLAKCGEDAAPAVPALVSLLHDPDEAIRQAAAAVVGAVGELDARTAPKLAAALKHRDNLLRARAAQAIGAIGSAAAALVPQLTAALVDPSDRVRQQSAWALGRLGAESANAVPALAKALQDEDFHVALRAAEAIGAVGPDAREAAPGLLRALRHINAEVRRHAAEALAKIAAPVERVAPALIEMAGDKDRDVRLAALASLGDLASAPPETVAVLTAALSDEAADVRQTAVDALGRIPIDDPTKLGPHLTRLFADPAAEVRLAAVTAVARAVPLEPDAVAALAERLQDSNDEVPIAAAQTLAKLGPAAAAAMPALRAAYPQAPAALRGRILRALAAVDSDANQPLFVSALEDADTDVRLFASAVLMRTSAPFDQAQLSKLAEGLKDPESQIRTNLAQVFGRMDALPAEAVPRLIEAATHTDDGLRLVAIRALRTAAGEGAHLWPRMLEDPHPQVAFAAARYVLDADPTHEAAGAVLVRSLSADTVRDRRQALDALDDLGPRAAHFAEAVASLVTSLAEDDDLRPRAQRWLASLAPPPA